MKRLNRRVEKGRTAVGWLGQCAVVAQANRLEKFSDSFGNYTKSKIDPGDVALGLAVLGGVVLVVWILAVFSARYREHKPYNSSWNLFLDLARAQKLRWSECWLLGRLAWCHGLKQPGLLFLEPGRFLPRNLPPRMKPWAPELKAIADRLFSKTDDPTPQVEKPKSRTAKQPTSPDGQPTAAARPAAEPPTAAKPPTAAPTVPHDYEDDYNPLAGIDLSLPSPPAPASNDPTETPESKPNDSASHEKQAACDFVVGQPPSLDLPSSLFETDGPTEVGNSESPA